VECNKLTCRYSVKGLVTEFTRKILCEACVNNNFCNYLELSEEDIEQLAPQIEIEPIMPLHGYWNVAEVLKLLK
jgi:hypothetical protein